MVFDFSVLGLVLVAAGVGAWKGCAWQAANVLSAVAGIGLGWPLSAVVGPHLGFVAPLDRLAALGLLYLAISLLVHGLALAFRKTLERAELRSWDHHVGFVTGAVKGFVLAFLLTLSGIGLSAELGPAVRSTRAGRAMGDLAAFLRPALPPAVNDLLEPLQPPAPKTALADRRY